MITLKSTHYTKEDYEYLMRIAVAAYHDCIEHRKVTAKHCKACLHTSVCRDLQNLAWYCKKKIIENADDC